MMNYLKNMISAIGMGLIIGLIFISAMNKNTVTQTNINTNINNAESPVLIQKNVSFNDNFTYVDIVDLPEDTQRTVYNISKLYNISYPLMLALIETESACDPEAISKTGDYGLCQINKVNIPRLEEELGINDIMAVEQNINSCCYLLAELFEKYDDPHEVLMAYNMGEAGMRKSGKWCSKYSTKILDREVEISNYIDERED